MVADSVLSAGARPVDGAGHGRSRSRVAVWSLLWLALGVIAAVVIARLPPFAGAGLVAGMALVWATVRCPAVGIAAVVASVPVQAVIEIDLGPAHMTATKTVVSAVVVATAVRFAVRRVRFRLDGISVAYALLVAALALSIVNAVDLTAWAGEVYRWAIALVIYAVAWDAVRTRQDVRLVLVATASGVLATAALGIAQVARGLGPASFGVGGRTRAFATFGEPNPFAGYLEMSVPLVLAVVLACLRASSRRVIKGWLGRPVLVAVTAAAGLGTVALALTQSRGGFLGLAAGVALTTWLTGGRVRTIGTVGGFAGLALLLVSPYGGSIAARFGDLSPNGGDGVQVTTRNFAVQERLAHWGAAIRMAKSQPLLGVGAGNFNAHFRDATPDWRFRIPRGHAHNAYLQALAQAGIVGLTAYLALLLTVGWHLVRSVTVARSDVERVLAIGACAVTAAVAMHNLFDYLHVLSLGLQLSVVWALVRPIDDHPASDDPAARAGRLGFA